MIKINEALEAEDKIRIFDLQKDIIDLKIQLVRSEGEDDKERINNEIEAINNQIQSIKDAAE